MLLWGQLGRAKGRQGPYIRKAACCTPHRAGARSVGSAPGMLHCARTPRISSALGMLHRAGAPGTGSALGIPNHAGIPGTGSAPGMLHCARIPRTSSALGMMHHARTPGISSAPGMLHPRVRPSHGLRYPAHLRAGEGSLSRDTLVLFSPRHLQPHSPFPMLHNRLGIQPFAPRCPACNRRGALGMCEVRGSLCSASTVPSPGLVPVTCGSG